MSNNSLFAEVPFKGDLKLIDEFYTILGVNISKGMLTIEKFECFFGGEEFGVSEFQFSVTVDEDLSVIEDKIINIGCEKIDEGLDVSGPFIILRDPAGLRVRVEVSEKVFRELVKSEQ